MTTAVSYSEVFSDYARRANRNFGSFDEYQAVITEDIQPTMVKRELKTMDFQEKSAIIVLGFSGNGKTTLVNNIIENYPNFTVASMDLATRECMLSGKDYTQEDVLNHFGEQIEKASENGLNLVLDGFFINIATRMVLISFLRKLDYQIYLIDMTPVITERLFYRADDVTVFRYHIKGMSHFSNAFKVYSSFYSQYDDSVLRNYIRSTDGWRIVKEEIDAHLKGEMQRGQYEEQVERNSFSIGIDAFLI